MKIVLSLIWNINNFYPLDHCRIFNVVTNKEVKYCKRRFFLHILKRSDKEKWQQVLIRISLSYDIAKFAILKQCNGILFLRN